MLENSCENTYTKAKLSQPENMDFERTIPEWMEILSLNVQKF